MTAEEYFELAQKENNPIEKIRYYEHVVKLTFNDSLKARVQYALSKLIDALPIFLEKKLHLDEKSAEFYYKRGVWYADLLFHEEAILDFTNAVNINPQFANAYYKRGISNRRNLLLTNRHDLAFKDFEKAIEIDPNNPDFRWSRAIHLLNRTNNYQTSLNDFLFVFNFYPNEVDLIDSIAENYEKIGDYRTAIIYLNKLVKLEPNEASYYMRRGDLKFHFGEEDEYYIEIKVGNQVIQIKHYEEDIFGDNIKRYAVNEYITYVSNPENRYKSAMDDYIKAIELDKDCTTSAHTGLGRCYYKLGRYNDAINTLNQEHQITDVTFSCLKKSIMALKNPENPPILEESTNNRIALIIGNGAYSQEIGDLGNFPKNDADEVVKLLQAVDFQPENIFLKYDLTKTAFEEVFRSFIQAAQTMQADVAVLYFAGHGIEVGNKVHYWLPIDATPNSTVADFIAVNLLIEQLGQAGVKIKVGFSDACRSNFFDKNDTTATRSTQISLIKDRGYPTSKPIPPEANTFFIYSTLSGRTAANNTNNVNSTNSPFLVALKKHLRRGEDIELMIRAVGNELSKTGQYAECSFIFGNEGFSW